MPTMSDILIPLSTQVFLVCIFGQRYPLKNTGDSRERKPFIDLHFKPEKTLPSVLQYEGESVLRAMNSAEKLLKEKIL